MGIPQSFLRWTQLGFINTSASVILNGHLGDPFPLTGGGCQGDNLFPLLFTLVVQGLASLIHKSGAKGIKQFNAQWLLFGDKSGYVESIHKIRESSLVPE